MEEPPAKLSKFQMESQYLEGEVMEEGQEEWLSEGILTDDDYNPASQPEHSDDILSQDSQDEAMNTASADDSQSQPDNSIENMDSNVSNIEDTLNNLENSQNISQISDLPEELNAFLIRKTDGKVVSTEAKKKESDLDESVKQSDDDGNDTDDLLRVLGDGDQAKQQNDMTGDVNKEHQDSTDEDDNFIFHGKKPKSFHVAQSVLSRAPAIKAEPEDEDPTDCSSDEENKMEKNFAIKKSKSPSIVTPQIITTVKPGNFTIIPLKPKVAPTPTKKIMKKVIQMPQSLPAAKKASCTVQVAPKPVEVKKSPNQRKYVNKHPIQRTSILPTVTTTKPLKEEIINKEELPKGAKVELQDKKLTEKANKESKPAQQLMRPEEMDEEVPTDNDSDSNEESLYSELPSSDSDVEDWFMLDIRAERAGEYLPMLGDRAYKLLSDEKRRVAHKLESLKKNLTVLTDSGRELADQIREATTTVAELDALLKVT